jgi:hypothetical protein
MMGDQRILQFIMNWLQVNNYVQFQGEVWTTGKDIKKVHPGRYNLVGRDPFYITNGELSDEALANLWSLCSVEIQRRVLGKRVK